MARNNDANSWDEYWNSSKSNKRAERIYSRVASFYRNKLIGPHLSRTLSKHFNSSSQLLHAGSGGGEVDRFVPKNISVFAIDISEHAIIQYSRVNPQYRSEVMNVFDLPGNLPKFDGIYNLGVMEHFSPEEVKQILIKFHSTLKPTGKLVIFWPPKFGLSVLALALIHSVLRIIQRGSFRPLHPAEPNKIGGKKSAKKVLEQSGFELTEYSFGIRDAFTYAVLVARKIV